MFRITILHKIQIKRNIIISYNAAPQTFNIKLGYHFFYINDVFEAKLQTMNIHTHQDIKVCTI